MGSEGSEREYRGILCCSKFFFLLWGEGWNNRTGENSYIKENMNWCSEDLLYSYVAVSISDEMRHNTFLNSSEFETHQSVISLKIFMWLIRDSFTFLKPRDQNSAGTTPATLYFY